MFFRYILTAYYMPVTMPDLGFAIISTTGKFLALMKFALKVQL